MSKAAQVAAMLVVGWGLISPLGVWADDVQVKLGDAADKFIVQDPSGTAKFSVASDGALVFADGTQLKTAPGIIYIRWGRTTCPTGATLLYNGYAGGGHYGQGGSGGTLCLAATPTWDDYSDANQNGALIYGMEYEMSGYGLASLASRHDYDARCAVCYRQDASVTFMQPGSQTCPTNWTAEYTGYLMSTHYTQVNRDWACVDRAAEATGSSTSNDGNLWYPTEYECGSLPCPPYVQDREATCAVCRK